MPLTDHQFYGYQIIQNQSNEKLALYCGGIDAKILREIVSVDNAVSWDPSSGVWKSGGRNRTINVQHWESIKEFLSSDNNERILPSAIVISVKKEAFKFEPFPRMEAIARTQPGLITIRGNYETIDGELVPVKEEDGTRTSWVLDGQHRISAFREWTMPDPYPVNVIIICAWSGTDYEDVMRHQTYELNMGRPLSNDFKAAVREQYTDQIGHKEYKKQIAISWIRKDMEGRSHENKVFDPVNIIGATNLRTPFILTMTTLENLIEFAFQSDHYLSEEFDLKNITKEQVKKVGKYLFDFYEGVRLSMGLINPHVKGTIGSEQEVNDAVDYWDIAKNTKHKQHLLHNVGLKAVTQALLNSVMRSSGRPQTPEEVAKILDKMKGIPWHDQHLVVKKDDWVTPLSNALKEMFKGRGTTNGKKYPLNLIKEDRRTHARVDSMTIQANGWND